MGLANGKKWVYKEDMQIEAGAGQYYFNIEDNKFISSGRYIGMENQMLVPGIVRGEIGIEPNWLRDILMLGTFMGTSLSGVWLLENKDARLGAVLGGLAMSVVTGIVYDNFPRIRSLFSRMLNKKSSFLVS